MEKVYAINHHHAEDTLVKSTRKAVVARALVLLAIVVGTGSAGVIGGNADTPRAEAATPSWQWKKTSGKESADLRDVVVLDNGTRIAIGDDSTIRRSEAGASWSYAALPGKGHLVAAATDGKSAVVVGTRGVAAYSADGTKWTKATVENKLTVAHFSEYFKNKPEGKLKFEPEGIRWMDVVWDGKQYVASAEAEMKDLRYTYSYPLIGVSADGSDWKLTPLVTKENVSLRGASLQLAKFKNKWIAIAREGVFYSSDLKKWNFKKTEIGADIHGVATDGKSLVAVGWDGRAGTGRALGGAVLVSEDGLTFARQSGAAFYNVSLNSVVWTAGRFVAAGHFGSLYESADGKKWKEKTQEHGDVRHGLVYVKYGGLKGNINAIAGASGGFVAVGTRGAIRSAQGPDEPWTLEAAGDNGDLHGVAYSEGKYAIAGNGTFKLSEDGRTWSPADAKADAGEEAKIDDAIVLYELYGTGGRFFGKGYRSTPESLLDRANLLYSAGSVADVSSSLPAGIAEASSAGGELRMFGSDRSAAAYRQSGWTRLNGVQAVPAATNGKLWLGYWEYDSYLSKDGRSWAISKATLDGQPFSYAIEKAVWTGSKFAAIKGSDLIESADGTKWTTVLKLRQDFPNALATDGSGTAVAVGDNGSVYLSEKGKAWTQAASPTAQTLRSVAWDGSRFLAVGDGGTILAGEKK